MKCFNCSEMIIGEAPYRYHDNSVGLIEFFKNLAIGICPSCQIIQTNHAQIEQDKLDQYYSYIYRDKAKLGIDSGGIYDKQYFTARAKAQAKLIRKYVKTTVQNIFEFGAGYGYILLEMKKYFPNAALFTNEIDKTITTLCELKKPILGMQYDVIIMSHVLEHLIYPQYTIENMIAQLKTEGVLFIEIPSEAHGIFDSQSPVEPHITFFTLNGLKDFIKKNFNDKLEIVYAGTAGLVPITPLLKNNIIIKFVKSLHYRALNLVRWILNGGCNLPYFNFENDTTQDIWNNIRIVCRKK